MKKFMLLCLLVSGALSISNLATAKDLGYALYPAIHDPTYIDKSWYAELKKQTPPPPTKGSAEQQADETELKRWQKERTEAQCKRANSEVTFQIINLFGQPAGPLTEAQTNALAGFLEKVRGDGSYFVQLLKDDFARPRPFVYLKELSPCVPKEKSMAYPSGHAAMSELYALILDDLFPTQKAKFEERAQEIATDRILGGVHHPTDVESGRKVAGIIYTRLKASKKFQDDFAAAKKQISQ